MFRFAIVAVLLSYSAFATVQEEHEYQQLRQALLRNQLPANYNSKLLLDAWWDLEMEGHQVLPPRFSKHWDAAEKIRYILLSNENREINLSSEVLSPRAKLLISIYREELIQKGYGFLVPETPQKFPTETFRPKTKSEIQDLVFKTPIPKNNYANTPRLFMFCRHNRHYPCLLLMKDANGKLVDDIETQTLWHQPALAASKYERPYHVRNGQTPSGVQTMDGVMPYANSPLNYGKFRRVILNWVGDASQTKQYLPSTASSKKWWQEASLARDVGRNLLRIHGTGKINQLPDSLWYPHIRTSGCVSQREGNYYEMFRDQRILLDTLMRAQGLTPTYSNEEKIKGIFYLIELDDETAPVSYLEVLSYLY